MPDRDRTEEALARLREAEEAMTRPWSSEWAFNARFVCPANGERISSSSLLRMKGHNDKADAAGIVLWRNAAPELIAVAEAAARVNAWMATDRWTQVEKVDGGAALDAALASLSAAVLGEEPKR